MFIFERHKLEESCGFVKYEVHLLFTQKNDLYCIF